MISPLNIDSSLSAKRYMEHLFKYFFKVLALTIYKNQLSNIHFLKIELITDVNNLICTLIINFIKFWLKKEHQL